LNKHQKKYPIKIQIHCYGGDASSTLTSWWKL